MLIKIRLAYRRRCSAIESLITGNGGREHTSSHSKSAKASDLDGPIPAHKDEEMRNILKSHSYGTLMNQTVDQSHIINTSATQLSTCPNCLLEMDSKKLKMLVLLRRIASSKTVHMVIQCNIYIARCFKKPHVSAVS